MLESCVICAAETRGRPESAYSACARCGHACRVSGGVPDSHYRAAPPRERGLSAEFSRKYAERATFIDRYVTDDASILEIGCSNGAFANLVKAKRKVRYVGVELSSDAETARGVVDGLRTVPIEDEPIFEEKFDLVLSFHVLEHITDPIAHLRAVFRITAADGVLIFEVPNGSGNPLLIEDPNPEHLHSFSLESLLLAFRAAGFAVIRAESGFRESAIYRDSLRIVARKATNEKGREEALKARFDQLPKEGIVVVGLGGDYRGYVEPNLERLAVRGFADGGALDGSTRRGFEVVPTKNYRSVFGDTPALIASYRFRHEIRQELEEQGLAPSRIFDLEDILG